MKDDVKALKHAKRLRGMLQKDSVRRVMSDVHVDRKAAMFSVCFDGEYFVVTVQPKYEAK